ncbi:MAG: hypothetical protein H6658_00855 [Ardenticatenaceae bacterium]|nr:hypothetical protein [Ardenticatenaceae bacterium]
MTHYKILATVCLLLCFASCTQTNQDFITPSTLHSTSVPLSSTKAPTTTLPPDTVTPTTLPTSTPLPTPTIEAVDAPAIVFTPDKELQILAQQPTRTPTTTPLPEIIWSNDAQIVKQIENVGDLAWSPTQNEFVYEDCNRYSRNGLNPDGSLWIASAPDFATSNLEPPANICNNYFSMIWQPTGEHLLFSGPHPEGEEIYDFAHLWMVDRQGNNLQSFDRWGKWLWFDGWMDDSKLVYGGWSGGGHTYAGIFDVNEGNGIAGGTTHGSFLHVNQSYVSATEIGTGGWWRFSGALFTYRVEQSDRYESGPFMRFLPEQDSWSRADLGSLPIGWMLEPDQMIVLTWSLEGINDIELIPANMQIQLWDVESNTLQPLIPEAVHGLISPNSQFLAFRTYSDEDGSSQIHLFNTSTREVIFTDTIFGELEPFWLDYSLHMGVFAPNGRYFAYLDPNLNLKIFDIETNQNITSLPSSPTEPVWATHSHSLLFRDPQNNWVLFDIDQSTQIALTMQSGDRVKKPQWSFDGRYLSFKICPTLCQEDAVILEIP